jgi:Protein of unknown function (DUF1579)
MTLVPSCCAVLVLGLSVSPCLAQADEGPAKNIPELAPLNRYAGSWDTNMTTNEGAIRELKRVGGVNGVWIHGGRFLAQTWSTEGQAGQVKVSGSSIYTYDPAKKTYKVWQFASNGHTADGEGTWDAKTKTLTWSVRETDPGITSVIKAHFLDDNTEDWTITTKDADGKVLSESSGKNTRK